MSTEATQQEKQVKADAVTTFFDGTYTEFFVASTTPDVRELVTTEFYERRPDLGEIERLKQVNWEVVVPEDTDLFVATSGLRRNYVNAFWVGWRTEDSLSALSIFQERPITVEVGSSDTLIHPAVVRPSGQMDQYFWRSEEQGWALFRHVFTGEMDEPGTVETRRLLQTSGQPELTTVAPVPGNEEGQVVVAWGERDEEGLILRAVLQNGEDLRRLTSMAIQETDFLPNQRLALHVIPGDVTAWVSGVIQLGGAQVGLLEGRFDFTEEETAAEVTSLPQPTDAQLHAAQTFYYQDPTEHRRFAGQLDEQGTLAVGRPGREDAHVLRRDVPLSYDFPILTSLGARYEVRGTEEGDVDLVSIP